MKLNIKPLIYYYYINDNWHQVEVPVEVTEMRIGTNPDMCEIQMEADGADDVQVLLKRIGQEWYLIESGSNQLMKVNGISSRQTQIHPRRSVMIEIGSISFIFSTRTDKLVLHKTAGSIVKMGSPHEGEFSLKLGLEQFRYSNDTLCIIGSNPLCEFNIPTQQQFCGYVTCGKKDFYFNSLIKHNEVLVSKNGLNVKGRVALKPGDAVMIDTYRIEFNVNEEGGFNPDSNVGKKSLALIHIDENGEMATIYRLPESGSSIYAGRSSSMSHIVLEGSTQISRQHAQIEVLDNKIQLLDTGAKNGLYVNDEKIENVYVYPGDLVSMADLNFFLGYA